MVSGLRQPEVSIAMRYLRENDWVDMRKKKNHGKADCKALQADGQMETLSTQLKKASLLRAKLFSRT